MNYTVHLYKVQHRMIFILVIMTV